jgi:hypothetical protein
MRKGRKLRGHNNKEKSSDKNKRSQNSNSRKGWSDVFDKLTYSSGPGDNIYVFG